MLVVLADELAFGGEFGQLVAVAAELFDRRFADLIRGAKFDRHQFAGTHVAISGLVVQAKSASCCFEVHRVCLSIRLLHRIAALRLSQNINTENE
ncbi:unannotated protein [freshwater metagenome]|uniref:Unannotated protein n=1 Tax=freshwater metagenome TaxID=449393 RepID=A0A6J6Z1Q8_9ZZZZ